MRFWGSLVLLLLVGCAPSGDDARNRMQSVIGWRGEYRLFYLDPPWEQVESSPEVTRLRVRSNAMSLGMVEVGPAKYELLVTIEAGAVGERIATEQAAASARGERTIAGPRDVEAQAGVRGQEFLTRVDDSAERHHRYAFFPAGPGRSVRLAFEATPSLDTDEVDAMISLLELGPRE